MPRQSFFVPTVLLVDDDRLLLNSITRSLSDAFRFVSLSSPLEALQWLAEHPNEVQAIVSDMMMPEMDGVQFLEKAQSMEPEIPRLLLSGFVTPSTLRAAVNTGMVSRVLVKPVRSQELRAALDGSIAAPHGIRPDQGVLPARISQALDAGDYSIVIQPRVAADTTQVMGGEVLSRLPILQQSWNLDQIFASVDDHPLINRIALGCLNQLERTVAGLPFCYDRRLNLSFNVSPFSVCNAGFSNELIDRILQLTNRNIVMEVEITETSRKAVSADFIRKLGVFAECGIPVLIDDFGSGNNSIQLLDHSVFSGVKIDRTLICNGRMMNSENSFVRWATRYARDNGMKVVAEGIEDRETAETLVEFGVNEFQGFLFGRPMDAGTFLHQTFANTGIP